MKRMRLFLKLPLWAATLLGLALVGATLLLRLALGFYLGDQPVLIIQVIPVLIGAYLGGIRVGLSSTVFAALLSSFFLLPPLYSLAIERPVNRVQWVALLAIGVCLSILLEKLHRARELNSITLTSIGDAVVATDRSGRVTFMNPSASSLLGCPLEEALGKPRESIFRVLDGTAMAKEAGLPNAAGESPSSGPEDKFLATGKGEPVPVDLSATPIRDSTGRVIGSVLVLRDLTERKKTRDSLARLNQDLQRRLDELQTIFDTVPVGLAIAEDAEGLVIRGNRTNERLLGLPPSGGLSKKGPNPAPYGIFRNGRELPMQDLPMQRAVRGEAVTGEVLQLQREDGTSAILFCNTSPLFDEDGRPRGAVGTFLDITELKRAEEDLRRSEAKFRTIFETNVVPIAYCRTDGLILDANDAYLDLLGRSRKDLLEGNVRWDTSTPPEWRRTDEIAVETLLRTGACRALEKEYIRPDGTRVPVLIGASCIPASPGHIVAFAIDLTSRKQMEESLAKARDELELKVQERTSELSATMAKLQESNQALQEFASIASHDMQEPLRKVNAFGKLLQERSRDSLDERSRDYLSRMLSATGRMRALLTSLLNYSRVTSKAEPFERVELGPLVEDVVSDLEVRIAREGGRVRIGPLPAINADPTQMRQLFQNLISNALKFHQEGENPVVSVLCDSACECSCRILVEDNGIGFAEEDLEKIFAPFQRLHGRCAYEGTGIGLAICKKIVERHGGRITAHSIPGAGTTFEVTLPLSQECN